MLPASPPRCAEAGTSHGTVGPRRGGQVTERWDQGGPPGITVDALSLETGTTAGQPNGGRVGLMAAPREALWKAKEVVPGERSPRELPIGLRHVGAGGPGQSHLSGWAGRDWEESRWRQPAKRAFLEAGEGEGEKWGRAGGGEGEAGSVLRGSLPTSHSSRSGEGAQARLGPGVRTCTKSLAPAHPGDSSSLSREFPVPCPMAQ